MALHVTPVNDLREHVNHGTDCWCKPEIDTTDDGELLDRAAVAYALRQAADMVERGQPVRKENFN